MPRPRLPSWPTTLTTLAVLIIHALVLWLLADLLFNLLFRRPTTETITPGPYLISALILSTLLLPILLLALRGRRPRGQRHCPRCWYTLDPTLGLKCSECGHEATSDRQTRKPRRRYKLAAATLCLIALCQLTWLETRIRRGGWLGAVPPEVLIVGMPWVPKEWIAADWSGGSERYSLFNRLYFLRPWQRSWASDRYGRWICSTRDPALLTDRVALTGYSNALEWASESTTERVVAHLLDVGIECMADPLASSQVETLWTKAARFASRWDPATLRMVPVASASRAIDARTDELLMRSRHSSYFIVPLSELFSLGDGRAEVVDYVLHHYSSHRGNYIPSQHLYQLAQRNDAVAARIADVLLQDNSRRRPFAFAVVGGGDIHDTPPAAIQSTIRSLLSSDDAESALLGARLARACPPDWHDEAIVRLLWAIENEPDEAWSAGLTLASYAYRLSVHLDEILRLASSDDESVRHAAFSVLVDAILLGSVTDLPALTRAREMLDAGAPLAEWQNRADLERRLEPSPPMLPAAERAALTP